MGKNTQATEQEPKTDAFDYSDVDRLSIECDIASQKVADQIELDKVLLEKIEMLLLVLEHDHVDKIERGVASDKLRELINRL